MKSQIYLPLAERMRPKDISGFVGQTHLLGHGRPLSLMIKQGYLPSMLFWGPPGTGKTTLARLLALAINRSFFSISAIESGVKDLREILKKAASPSELSLGAPILFIDEIHRFSKAQQDALLGAVEQGTIILIGATTQNPGFEIISALHSRTQLYLLKPHDVQSLEMILDRALKQDVFLSQKSIQIKDKQSLIHYADGDARKLLNILESCLQSLESKPEQNLYVVDIDIISNILQNQRVLYDKKGEQYYDLISVFIKSIRGSDPHAAVYWLARMIDGGAPAAFIARRLLILASEDIGLANPTALILANSTLQAIEKIGFPEARIILSQCVLYLASSPKSNSCYDAINQAEGLVKETGSLSVPLAFRNPSNKILKGLGYGNGYKYAHDFNQNFIYQDFMPNSLTNKTLYKPGNNTKEHQIKERLLALWRDKYNLD